jgi:hypothetical protein
MYIVLSGEKNRSLFRPDWVHINFLALRWEPASETWNSLKFGEPRSSTLPVFLCTCQFFDLHPSGFLFLTIPGNSS